MANTHSLDLEASSSQYASIADGSQTGLDLSGDFTLEAWIRFESLPGSGRFGIVDKADGGNGQTAYSLYYDLANSRIALFISDDGSGGANTEGYVSWSPSTDTWYHVAVSYNTSTTTAKFYIGESQQGSDVTTFDQASIFNSDKEFIIGASHGNPSIIASFFDGLVDEVRVWSDVRTITEIADNYDLELEGDEANLVGYWQFNNDYLDQTSNDNDLTASGSPVFSSTVPFVGGTSYALVMAVGAFTLTGIATIFNRAIGMIASVGSFTLTGIATTFKLGKGFVASAGSFILTGIDAIFRDSGWTYGTKPTDSWTEDSKPSDSWTNDSK
jgi:hypothetical protein